MFLNSETDYAIRIVACLAQHNEKLDAASISSFTGVTLRYSLKILRRLTQGNIVKSFKGAKGGYILSRSSQYITLFDVIELICGPISFSRCQGSSDACTHPQGMCYFRKTFDDVSCFMEKTFKSVTFKTED